jgi:hypothetical protein
MTKDTCEIRCLVPHRPLCHYLREFVRERQVPCVPEDRVSCLEFLRRVADASGIGHLVQEK